MADWFIQSENEIGEIGPLRPTELLEQVRAGKVAPQTLVRKDDSAWFPARDVGGLFEAATRPITDYFCPFCGKPVAKAPTTCKHCDGDVYQAIERQRKRETANPAENGKRKSVKNWLLKKRISGD